MTAGKMYGGDYRDEMGRRCYALAGGGFQRDRIPDLGMKLDFFLAMAGLNPFRWPDVNLGLIVFGASDPAGKMSRKRVGGTVLTEEDGAVLAQLLNALTRLSPEQRNGYSSRNAEILVADMESRVPGNSGLWASDLARPLHEFLGCAARAIAAAPSEGEDDRRRNFDTAHDRLMTHFNALAAHSNETEPLGLLPSRSLSPERFGDAQTPPNLPVWEWPPVLLRAGDEIRVDVPGEATRGTDLFGLTVRDPRPPAPGPRAGPYAWDEPWERLFRWSVPPVPAADGAQSLRFGRVVDLPGLYSLFVLVDPEEPGAARELIGEIENGSAGMDAVLRLLAQATSRRLGVDCYVRRYRVGG